MPPHWVAAAVFAGAAVICFLGARQEAPLQNQDARRGLSALLVIVGLWSGLQAAQMVTPVEPVAEGLLTAALVVGFGTVWAWLWFVSAYTGHDYHRRRSYQFVAVGAYASVTAIKLTNPLHGLYFSAEFVTTPYPQLVVDQQPFYWGSFILAYALSAVGFYLLFKTFRRSAQSTLPLAALVGVTALPVIPNVVSAYFPTSLPELSYEPLGVAVFALGALYLVEDTFRRLEVPAQQTAFETVPEAVLVVDSTGTVVEYNENAGALLPQLESSSPTLTELFPELSDSTETSTLLTRDVDGTTRHLLVSDHPVSMGAEQVGRTVLVQDVTEAKYRQRELERHNRHLEEMAGAIAHELRNTVTITRGYLRQARDELPDAEAADDSVAVATETLDRIGCIVDDLHALTKYTQSVDTKQALSFATVVDEAYDPAVFSGSYSIEGTGDIETAPDRLKQLLNNVFRFAAFNDATTVQFTLSSDGFTVTDDGQYTAVGHGETIFTYEAAAPATDAGMMLPNVRTLAEVQGWTVTADTEYDSGMRYRICGATVTPNDQTTAATSEPLVDADQA